MKLKKLFAIFISVSLLASCDFMDCNESDYYSLKEIQGSYNRVKQFVTDVYGYLPSNFCNIDGAMLDAATDDAVHIYESSNIKRFVNGTWSPNYTVDDQFANYYNGIHDANFYLENLTGLKFETWENTNDYDNWMITYPNFEYEVRFLRAYFYFVTQAEANAAEPASAEQIFDFIISECTELSTLLPVDYTKMPGSEYGRATRGAALALKARAALYAASPLFNSGNNKSKWVAAAEAAYEIIGQSSALGYKLDASFSNLFGATNTASNEVILVRPTGTSTSFEAANFPMGVTGGKTTTCPTENLASAFEMATGEEFDWNNEAMSQNPYTGRDPRFYLTIVHNGMTWPAKNAVEIHEGGANGLPLTNATSTGYYLRKYVNNSISFEAGSSSAATHHNWVLFRYAEVLLNYAEAMVNAYGDPDYTGSYSLSARDAVNQVRNRGDVKMPAYPTDMKKDAFLKRLRNERRVEFAFEGQRFWDLRRWKELDNMQNIYKVKVVKQTDGTIQYTKVLHATYNIQDKMYFYPISNTELFKNHKLVQNTGW